MSCMRHPCHVRERAVLTEEKKIEGDDKQSST